MPVYNVKITILPKERLFRIGAGSLSEAEVMVRAMFLKNLENIVKYTIDVQKADRSSERRRGSI